MRRNYALFKKGRKKCTEFKYIYIYLYITGWLLFMQKRQNRIGFPLIRKEGEISLTGLSFWLRWDGVQTPEMQSRLRAFPFLTGLTWGRVLPPPTHTSQPFIHPDQTVKSISQRFLSPQITPSQPASPPDRSCKIG